MLDNTEQNSLEETAVAVAVGPGAWDQLLATN